MKQVTVFINLCKTQTVYSLTRAAYIKTDILEIELIHYTRSTYKLNSTTIMDIKFVHTMTPYQDVI